jgi:hypothetical protein
MKLIMLAFLASASVPASAAQVSNPSAVTSPSVSQDEIAIYELVLASWLGKERGHQLVNEQLSAAPSRDDPDFADCTKGLHFPEVIQGDDSTKSLRGVRFNRTGIELIDGSQWSPADPGKAIAAGKPVDAAVAEGFSHSLISFSRILFSRDDSDALVKFSMVCGGLCGSGSTIHLRKSSRGWAIVNRCGGWVS